MARERGDGEWCQGISKNRGNSCMLHKFSRSPACMMIKIIQLCAAVGFLSVSADGADKTSEHPGFN
jgi:hypothetical protein